MPDERQLFSLSQGAVKEEKVIREEQTFKDGKKYVGQWLVSSEIVAARHGQGMCTWPSGGRYDGQWKRDKRSGKGTYWYANGGKYDGEWLDDKKRGKGICTFASGAKYQGDWEHDLEHGWGIYEWADGRKYEGQF